MLRSREQKSDMGAVERGLASMETTATREHGQMSCANRNGCPGQLLSLLDLQIVSN